MKLKLINILLAVCLLACCLIAPVNAYTETSQSLDDTADTAGGIQDYIELYEPPTREDYAARGVLCVVISIVFCILTAIII